MVQNEVKPVGAGKRAEERGRVYREEKPEKKAKKQTDQLSKERGGHVPRGTVCSYITAVAHVRAGKKS